MNVLTAVAVAPKINKNQQAIKIPDCQDDDETATSDPIICSSFLLLVSCFVGWKIGKVLIFTLLPTLIVQ